MLLLSLSSPKLISPRWLRFRICVRPILTCYLSAHTLWLSRHFSRQIQRLQTVIRLLLIKSPFTSCVHNDEKKSKFSVSITPMGVPATTTVTTTEDKQFRTQSPTDSSFWLEHTVFCVTIFWPIKIVCFIRSRIFDQGDQRFRVFTEEMTENKLLRSKYTQLSFLRRKLVNMMFNVKDCQSQQQSGIWGGPLADLWRWHNFRFLSLR